MSSIQASALFFTFRSKSIYHILMSIELILVFFATYANQGILELFYASQMNLLQAFIIWDMMNTSLFSTFTAISYTFPANLHPLKSPFHSPTFSVSVSIYSDESSLMIRCKYFPFPFMEDSPSLIDKRIKCISAIANTSAFISSSPSYSEGTLSSVATWWHGVQHNSHHLHCDIFPCKISRCLSPPAFFRGVVGWRRGCKIFFR